MPRLSAKRHTRWTVLLLAAVVVGASAACESNPTGIINRNPTILSVRVFPDALGPTDSAVVICNAIDPDGEAIVYDWITDPRLTIKGAPSWEHALYKTTDNSQIFYVGANTPNDTAWVQCFARDNRGGAAARIVYVIVP
jgi:hypothetical protein